MKEQSNGVNLNAAVVSDRGLSKKRPLNEDSFLSDPERRIFAVADGVGGAQAGEVASQTAMEVLDEAFRHYEAGTDIEDLLEIAIQRANSSIHRMSREHPKLSMMATTVVALHLDGRIATIGHVGDSRLYRLAPDGQLHRETADHSVVEEEVRAGRMTPEQASNHPSRNVISRALGAEETVEVDLKTMEVADGTSFLLCSDGITRHIPDPEIRSLLTSGMELNAICEEMKRLCYERGAEDNLTAVIVRVGDAVTFDDERTLVAERPHLAATMDGGPAAPAAMQATVGADAAAVDADSDNELHRTVEPAKLGPPKGAVGAEPSTGDTGKRRSAAGTVLRALGFLILLGAIGAAAFFGGIFFQRRATALEQQALNANTPPAPPAEHANPSAEMDRKRRELDQDPFKWLETTTAKDIEARTLRGEELSSIDLDNLFLYGRARLLTRSYDEARKVLQEVVRQIDAGRADRADLRHEAKIMAFAAAAGQAKLNALTEFELNVPTKGSNGVGAAPSGVKDGSVQKLPDAPKQ